MAMKALNGLHAYVEGASDDAVRIHQAGTDTLHIHGDGKLEWQSAGSLTQSGGNLLMDTDLDVEGDITVNEDDAGHRLWFGSAGTVSLYDDSGVLKTPNNVHAVGLELTGKQGITRSGSWSQFLELENTDSTNGPFIELTNPDGTWSVEAESDDINWYRSGGNRMKLLNEGQLQLPFTGSGGGLVLGAVNLYDQSGILKTDDAFQAAGGLTALNSDGRIDRELTVRSATATEVEIGNVGPSGESGITFDQGDTNLYRSADSTLKTDDDFVVGGTLTSGGIEIGDVIGNPSYPGLAETSNASSTNYALLQQTSGNVFLNSPTGTSIVFRTNNGVGDQMVFSGGDLSINGLLTQTDANALLAVRSGASGSYTGIDIGRTAIEGIVAVAAGNNHFGTGTVAGDFVVKNNTAANDLWLGVGTVPNEIVLSDDAIALNSDVTLGGSLIGPTDPTAGTHVGDRDYNDSRYALAEADTAPHFSSHNPYLANSTVSAAVFDLYAVEISVPQDGTVLNGVRIYGIGSSYGARASLYNSSGTRLASSSQNTSLGGGYGAWIDIPFNDDGSPTAETVDAGLYWIGVQFNSGSASAIMHIVTAGALLDTSPTNMAAPASITVDRDGIKEVPVMVTY